MKGRPAESTAAVAGMGSLLAYVFGVRNPETLAAMLAGISLLPASVTLLVSNGGIRGVARLIWRGKVVNEA